jgi:hypothetical protein
MRLDTALKKIRPQYISAEKFSTLFDEIAREFSDARALMAAPVDLINKKISI